jgi:hypothetical protein
MLLWDNRYITDTKLLQLTEESAPLLYNKISKLKSVQNKTKLLRLLHGDVYCGARLYRFGLLDSDRCIRCFDEETVSHLLYQCPYSKEVWGRLGLFPNRASDLIHEYVTKVDLEIKAELINNLVFRKKVLPPEALIKSVINSFRQGLSQSKGVREYATTMIERFEITGQWFT